MSRIGKQPISIPQDVQIKQDSQLISVIGPKGELQQIKLKGISFIIKENQCLVERQDDRKLYKARHGLMRSLVANMVLGVKDGFSKELEIVGIGYRVKMDGDKLIFNLGFSHEIIFLIPKGITVELEGMKIKVSGIDKQKVGQTAARIYNLKKPEPYKGLGIRYKNQIILRKAGKGGKEN